MKRLTLACLLVAVPAVALRAAEEPSVADLKKELARTKAELAVMKAEADLAKKKKELQALVDGKEPGDGAEPKPDQDKPKPKTETPPEDPHAPLTSHYGKEMPKFAWRSVSKSGSDLFIIGGTRVLAPYEIDVATKKLSTGKNQLGGFMEIFYSNTWAWQPDGAESSIAYGLAHRLGRGDESQWTDRWKPHNGGFRLESDSDAVVDWGGKMLFSGDWDDTSDFSARFSFEFANGSAPSPTTVTGSGDFSGEISFNKHFLQGYSPNSLFTLGLGGSIGATTDRAARRTHPRFFAGLVGKMSRVIQVDKDGTNRLALVHVGVGLAEIENVQFDPADPTKTTLLFDGPGPLYKRHRGPAAELDLFYPVGKASYATVNARLYGKTDPTPWSLSIGYTIDPIGALKGFIPDSSASEPDKSKEKKAEKPE